MATRLRSAQVAKGLGAAGPKVRGGSRGQEAGETVRDLSCGGKERVEPAAGDLNRFMDPLSSSGRLMEFRPRYLRTLCCRARPGMISRLSAGGVVLSLSVDEHTRLDLLLRSLRNKRLGRTSCRAGSDQRISINEGRHGRRHADQMLLPAMLMHDLIQVPLAPR